MNTRYLAILATLAFLGFSVPAAAHDCDGHKDKTHKHCPGDPTPEPSGGGKAFLFEIPAADLSKCGGATDTGTSFGHVSWAGNVLWDENFIHVHFKLQLEDVAPSTYPIFGNFDMTDVLINTGCDNGNPVYPEQLCTDGVCDLEITVKQNQRGRTSGALRLPGCEPDEPTTVWVTVTVDGNSKILRSTPVTIVLPPNEVGDGSECL